MIGNISKCFKGDKSDDGGVGSNDFVINVTEIGKKKGDNNGFTECDASLDKTFDEIFSAYKAGKRVYVKADVSAAYGDDAEFYLEAPLVQIGGSASDGGGALFSFTDDWGRTHSLWIDHNNIATYRELGIQRQITNNSDVPAASGAVKEYVDKSIQTAIGDVLGGAS